MKRKWWAVLIALACIVAGFAFYHFYYTRTPHYAVQDALVAAKNHDLAHFENRVDLDTLIGSAYDDIIAPAQAESNPFLTALAAKFRPPVVALFRYVIRQAVDPTTILPKPPDIPLLKQADPDPEAFRRFEVRNISTVSEEKDLAQVDIKVRNQQTDRYCVVQLQLSKDSTGYWRIRKIINIKDTLDFFNDHSPNTLPPITK